mmetsp:Transcript_9012/g.19462  ORF Transcript_9012/g.19462 Transcript_9012/m.19462 type:complete len:397 (+) Transcript_9012:2005-3195(+)
MAMRSSQVLEIWSDFWGDFFWGDFFLGEGAFAALALRAGDFLAAAAALDADFLRLGDGAGSVSSSSCSFASWATIVGLRVRLDRRAEAEDTTSSGTSGASSSSSGSPRFLLDRLALVAPSSRLDTSSEATSAVFLLDRLVGRVDVTSSASTSSAGALEGLAARADLLRELVLLLVSSSGEDLASFFLVDGFAFAFDVTASGGDFSPTSTAFSVGFLVLLLFLRPVASSSGGDFKLPSASAGAASAAAFFARGLFLRGGASFATRGVRLILTCPRDSLTLSFAPAPFFSSFAGVRLASLAGGFSLPISFSSASAAPPSTLTGVLCALLFLASFSAMRLAYASAEAELRGRLMAVLGNLNADSSSSSSESENNPALSSSFASFLVTSPSLFLAGAFFG